MQASSLLTETKRRESCRVQGQRLPPSPPPLNILIRIFCARARLPSCRQQAAAEPCKLGLASGASKLTNGRRRRIELCMANRFVESSIIITNSRLTFIESRKARRRRRLRRLQSSRVGRQAAAHRCFAVNWNAAATVQRATTLLANVACAKPTAAPPTQFECSARSEQHLS